MKYLSPLSLAACVLLTGCQVFKTSSTWKKVNQVRPHAPQSDAASDVYADRLHAVLKADAIEHKVVTYKYRYTTRMREEAVGSRTAVIYKDGVDPNHPWWLMDERTARPVWLPNGVAEQQLSFYLRDRAEVVAEKQFSADSAGKEMLASTTRPSFAPRLNVTARIAALAKKAAPTAAGSDRAWDELFRKMNGTDYDPCSPLDRQKMEVLKHGATASITPVPGQGL